MPTLNDTIIGTRTYLAGHRAPLTDSLAALDEIYDRHHLRFGGDDYAISNALDPDCQTFATTSLYWDCECLEAYIHPAQVSVCEDCDRYRDDQPDSRIDEVLAHDLPLDLNKLGTRLTLDFHSIGYLAD